MEGLALRRVLRAPSFHPPNPGTWSRTAASKIQCSPRATSKAVFSAEKNSGDVREGGARSWSLGDWDTIVARLQTSTASSPEVSLREGRWVKLICGASFEDVAEVRNLSLVYTLAGVDCIDCAADSAVVAAVVDGVNAAKHVLQNLQNDGGSLFKKPWIMISINDDEDPHFRKAEFNSQHCPPDCPRPCERVCPALAIKFQEPSEGKEAGATPLEGGIIMERCYGCGRCLPICPMGLISARTYVRPIEAVADLILNGHVDAIEIHTGEGHMKTFENLIAKLGSTLALLKLVAVSVPDLGESMIPTLSTMYTLMQPFVKNLNLWQLDGRPMSGDIGLGATRASVNLAARVAASPDRPRGHYIPFLTYPVSPGHGGYLQLAGGTNNHTVAAMNKMGLCADTTSSRDCQEDKQDAVIAGVGYGGYARKIVKKFFENLQDEDRAICGSVSPRSRLLECRPSLLASAVLEAAALVDTVKSSSR